MAEEHLAHVAREAAVSDKIMQEDRESVLLALQLQDQHREEVSRPVGPTLPTSAECSAKRGHCSSST